jgi:putative inorganic carbon (HCO3(-)) transporter
LFGGLLFQSGVAVAQHMRGTVLGLSWLGEAPAEHLAKAIAPGIMLWRSGGAMGHPNVLATFLVGLIPLSLGVAVQRGRYWAVRVLSISTFFLACAALVWTYSRGAWISLLAVAAFVCLVGLRKILGSRIIVPGVLLAAMILGVMFPAIRHRLLHTESSATDVRFALVPVAVRMAGRYPFHGVGLNHFARNIESFDPEMKLELFRHPVHNIVLLDLAEGGILAGIVSGLLFGAVGIVAATKIRIGIVQNRPILTAVWSGCAAIVIHNMGDWTLRRPDILLLCWVLIALGSSEAVDMVRLHND